MVPIGIISEQQTVPTSSFLVDWATKMVLSRFVQKPNPFHLFLTGGAGVGKSHLVHTIVQTVNKLFAVNF
jgi:chromosomal replication initiation ATPase DnaA